MRTGLQYDRPSISHICTYIEFLAARRKCPKSVRNDISSIRTYFRLAGLPTASIDSIQVNLALRALDMDVRHVPDQKDPASPHVVYHVVRVLSARENGPMLAYGVVLMFQAFLRQSNLLPRTVAEYDYTRQMAVQDVVVHTDRITLHIKWSKTTQKYGDARHIELYAINSSPLCPRHLHFLAQLSSPPMSPRAPLIRFRDGNPITVSHFNRQWKEALMSLGCDPQKLSLHSLRRGGASYAYYDHNATLLEVKRHGSWASDAVRAYLRPLVPRKSRIHQAMLHLP